VAATFTATTPSQKTAATGAVAPLTAHRFTLFQPCTIFTPDGKAWHALVSIPLFPNIHTPPPFSFLRTPPTPQLLSLEGLSSFTLTRPFSTILDLGLWHTTRNTGHQLGKKLHSCQPAQSPEAGCNCKSHPVQWGGLNHVPRGEHRKLWHQENAELNHHTRWGGGGVTQAALDNRDDHKS